MRFLALGAVAFFVACGSVPATPCRTDNDCAAVSGRTVCDATQKLCVVGAARAPLIGKGDGTPSSVVLTSIYEPARPRQPTGLAFNPAHPEELWIVNRADDTVITVSNPGTPQANVTLRKDPDALHFMHMPTGIAFTGDKSWVTCGENDGSHDGKPHFTGPAAFSADPAIFAKPTPGGLGSHLDMLHDSDWCMGAAHERDHVWWVFDGGHQSLARYDFHDYHQPGGDDHSDGEIWHYAMGAVKRLPNVPSGLAFNPDDAQLYVVDSGNARIVKLDTRSGTQGQQLPTLEPTVPIAMDNATLAEIVPAGSLQAPSGMALKDGVLYVTDNASSRFYAFDLSGTLLRTLDTGLPSGSLAGITVGPETKIYFVDMMASRAYRIDVP